MKNNYFLKLANSFKKIGYRVNYLFKNETERSRDFLELSVCLQLGKLDKFEEFFYKKYSGGSFVLLVSSAVGNGKLETFLKLEEKAIELKKIHKYYRQIFRSPSDMKIKYLLDGDFYGTALTSTMSYDNKDVLEYLVVNKHINLFEIGSEHILEASNRGSITVLNYLLYDLKFKPTNSLMEMLRCDKDGVNHTDTLALIEKRDLLFQLGHELNKVSTTNKSKPKKI